jgi:hypothetical protein
VKPKASVLIHGQRKGLGAGILVALRLAHSPASLGIEIIQAAFCNTVASSLGV